MCWSYIFLKGGEVMMLATCFVCFCYLLVLCIWPCVISLVVVGCMCLALSFLSRSWRRRRYRLVLHYDVLCCMAYEGSARGFSKCKIMNVGITLRSCQVWQGSATQCTRHQTQGEPGAPPTNLTQAFVWTVQLYLDQKVAIDLYITHVVEYPQISSVWEMRLELL